MRLAREARAAASAKKWKEEMDAITVKPLPASQVLPTTPSGRPIMKELPIKKELPTPSELPSSVLPKYLPKHQKPLGPGYSDKLKAH